MTRLDHHAALFDSTYLRWFDLQDYPALVKIIQAEKKEVTLPGGVVKNKGVLYFELMEGRIETVKPLVLNRTNRVSIAKIHGKWVKEWPGKEIVLFQDECRGVEGDMVECIRIRARKAAKAE